MPPGGDDTLDVPLDVRDPSYDPETLEEISRSLLLFEFLCWPLLDLVHGLGLGKLLLNLRVEPSPVCPLRPLLSVLGDHHTPHTTVLFPACPSPPLCTVVFGTRCSMHLQRMGGFSPSREMLLHLLSRAWISEPPRVEWSLTGGGRPSHASSVDPFSVADAPSLCS